MFESLNTRYCGIYINSKYNNKIVLQVRFVTDMENKKLHYAI